jgi:hypothetical protein
MKCLLLVLFLISLPPALTHLFYMGCVYIWLTALLLPALYIVVRIANRMLAYCCASKGVDRLTYRLFLLFMVMIMYQNYFNYGILWYEKSTSYMGVISKEYHMRDTVCWWDYLITTAFNQAHVQFLSSLIL